MTSGIQIPTIIAHETRPMNLDARQDKAEPRTGSNVSSVIPAFGAILTTIFVLALLFAVISMPPVALLAVMIVLPALVPMALFTLVYFALHAEKVESDRGS
ncbi:MAG: hypothetical protein FJ303_13745 [Planctomycetes bacterium]|nr:hypothetical protein [Planctomycetota bacterium]